jgi:succinyl-CoA synthetase beta subunit
MKVLECAKQLLGLRGIPVPEGRVVSTAEEAGEAADALYGPVVLKVQIPTGRRIKAGGIRFAGTPAEAAAETDKLLRSAVFGFDVRYVQRTRLHP